MFSVHDAWACLWRRFTLLEAVREVEFKKMDLDKGAGLTLERETIPQELQFLVPCVEKWSFAQLEDQDAFVAEMREHRAEELLQFNRAVDAADELIRAWAKTLPFANKHLSEMTPEDWQHPYWAFLHVLKLREITGYDDDPEVTAVRERFAREVRIERYREATLKADEAFRRHDYAVVVSILEPFDDLLTPTQQKKKALALRKAGGSRTPPRD
jgi:hypothetical protein